MKFISKSLFYFVETEDLRSEFYGAQLGNNKILIGSNSNILDISSPKVLFESLVVGTMQLDVMTVLALMSWQDNLWVSSNGKEAMKNFWLSALESKEEGNHTYYFMMILRVILSDAERYPAPTNVIQTMTSSLRELITQGEVKQYDTSIDILKIFTDEKEAIHQEKSLAKLAFNQTESVRSLMKKAGFPYKLPIVKNANFHWLKHYINSSFTVRKNLNISVNEVLNSYKKLKDQQSMAKLILSEPLFNRSLITLAKTIEDFPEFIHWLSICDRNKLFREKFTPHEIQQLNIWVGTGNYQSLSKLLVEITKYESSDPEAAISRTKSRYIFWENYQHLFRESWLLVSSSTYNNHAELKKLKNVKILNGMSNPVILIRIGQYYLAQMFIESASNVDFFMVDNASRMETLLDALEVSFFQLKQQNVCLVHDHRYKWQADLAFVLDKSFNISATGNSINVTPSMTKNYLIEVGNRDFQLERKKEVEIWFKNVKYRWDLSTLAKAALTAKRYNLI